MPTIRSIALTALTAALAAGCGGSSSPPAGGCDPNSSTSCSSGLVCAQVSGGSTMCAAPVQLSGQVFDLATTAGISGARVVALDANQAPVAPAAVTDSSGNYAIAVPATRNSSGSPVGSVTLRADAAGYQTFPSGLRVAFPVDLSTATLVSGTYKVTTATNIGLQALPAGSYATLHGTVAASPTKGGVLVVAQPAAGGTGVSGFADQSGTYYIYNVPLATVTSWTVQPYAQGVNYVVSTSSANTVPLTLASGNSYEVDFSTGSTVPYTLGGSVQFVGQNLPTTPVTSVILMVKSTYDTKTHRGWAPPGLRAGNVTATSPTFGIPGVPDGDYVVLAAYENDGLVQDPGQGSTGLYEVVVSGGALSTVYLNGTLQSNTTIAFKVTGAVSLGDPFTGIYDTEPWPTANATSPSTPTTPTFDWVAYPSTIQYDVEVIDYLGNPVCSKTGIPSYATLAFTWNATDCKGASNAAAKTWYQFVVKAYQNGTSGLVEASFSEDLKGVFYTP